jgi:hypothetical protein
MEYLIGSLVTLVAFIVLSRIVRKEPIKNYSIRNSQSYIDSLVSPYLPQSFFVPEPKATQARKHFYDTQVRIVFFENKAYWIADGSFVEADLVDGEINEETKRAVDIMSMDKIQLDKMIFIVDKLTEGKINDSGSTGH